jgi:hypothetical protein
LVWHKIARHTGGGEAPGQWDERTAHAAQPNGSVIVELMMFLRADSSTGTVDNSMLMSEAERAEGLT